MISKSLVNAGVAALMLGTGAAAQAAPINVNLGFANGSVGMTVGVTNEASPNDYISASAGAFKGQSGSVAQGGFASSPFNTSSFITYCVQLTQNFALNTTYGAYSYVGGGSYFSGVMPALNASGAVVGRLENLFSSLGNNNSPSTPERSAAIQLAVWEAIYEGTTGYGQVGGYTDGGGTFGAANTTTGVVTAAESILAAAIAYGNNNGPKLFSVGVLTNRDRQDFIVLEGGGFQSGNVPEPATLALVLAALGGVGVMSRRRKSA